MLICTENGIQNVYIPSLITSISTYDEDVKKWKSDVESIFSKFRSPIKEITIVK